MSCPDDDTLASIATLSERERAAIAEHAATCEVCGSRVKRLLAGLPTNFAEAETLASDSGVIARGVEAAHDRGIVHRDLKLDNIFVSRTGDVLVGDFGLATSISEPVPAADVLVSELTVTGAVLGTPAYMAPEEFEGEATPASDQFSLCVTAWEALWGTRPFTGTTFDELAAAVRAGPPPDPRTRSVPSHVRAAIRRGLAADPDARHPSISLKAEALENAALFSPRSPTAPTIKRCVRAGSTTRSHISSNFLPMPESSTPYNRFTVARCSSPVASARRFLT